MPRTDYAAHDGVYRQLRARGATGFSTPADYLAFEAELDWAIAGLGPLAGARVLELGCGAGNMARWFLDRGADFTGIDVSPTAIDWANERGLANARFLVGNLVEDVPGQYELVVDGHCLHCIIGGDRARLLANVWKALAPGGHFFVSTMCGAVTQPALKACFDPQTRCQVVDGVARRFIGDADELLEELRAARFELVRSTIRVRADADDQDHLWALARKPVEPANR